jgi:aryl-alcohol dehydrogenase-like predicted oxidoreductase
LRIACLLRDIGNRHGRSAGEAAIAWTLNRPAVTGAIVGMRNPQQVAGIIGAAELRLGQSEVIELDDALTQELALAKNGC